MDFRYVYLGYNGTYDVLRSRLRAMGATPHISYAVPLNAITRRQQVDIRHLYRRTLPAIFQPPAFGARLTDAHSA